MTVCDQHSRLVQKIDNLIDALGRSREVEIALSTKIDQLVTRRELDAETEKLRKSISQSRLSLGAITGLLIALGGAVVYYIQHLPTG